MTNLRDSLKKAVEALTIADVVDVCKETLAKIKAKHPDI
jgi:hypothetical protein